MEISKADFNEIMEGTENYDPNVREADSKEDYVEQLLFRIMTGAEFNFLKKLARDKAEAFNKLIDYMDTLLKEKSPHHNLSELREELGIPEEDEGILYELWLTIFAVSCKAGV